MQAIAKLRGFLICLLHSGTKQFVQIRSPHVCGTTTLQVRISEVIGKNHEQIGTRFICREGRCGNPNHAQQQ